MPLLRFCLEPGCTRTIPITRKRCTEHQAAARARTLPQRRRHYAAKASKPQRQVWTDKRWNGPHGTRAIVLARDKRCVLCGGEAKVCDHQICWGRAGPFVAR
jgi:hypothetical protein